MREDEIMGHLAAIVDSSDDAILSKSLEGVILSWNRAAEKLYGYTAEEMVGRHISTLVPPDRSGEVDDILARVRAGEAVDHFETVRVGKDGAVVPVSLTISPVLDGSGSVVAASTIGRDIRERNRLQAELEQLNRELTLLARHDVLTGLGNRMSLDEDLNLLRARSARYQHPFAIALLDIDHFKIYNDTYGHVSGDHALSAVGAAIMRSSRLEDGLYRFGGEEFLCLFPEQSPAEALAATNRIRARVEALAIPHRGNPPYGVVTLSAGIATVSPGQDLRAEDLLKEADTALYRAKELGRNRVECRTTILPLVGDGPPGSHPPH